MPASTAAAPALDPVPVDGVPVDGRRARGERTRQQVLDALLALVDEGELRPTAQQVAHRAGVALRTLYHHFADVEELRRSALVLQLRRQVDTLAPVREGDDLETRIRFVARELRKQFEAMTPIRRATIFDEHVSADTEAGLRSYRAIRRQYIARSFGREIAKRRSEGRTFLDALDTATNWELWEHLRSYLGRSAVAAEKTLVLTLQRLFGK